MSQQTMPWEVSLFTQGKNPPHNEDFVGFNATTLVLSDGATDKTSFVYQEKTGGAIAAEAIVQACLESSATGNELVRTLSQRLRSIYKEINPQALIHSQYRFSATMVAAKVVGDQVMIIQIGDSSFRINGKHVFTNGKKLDQENALIRKEVIEQTGDVSRGREAISDRLHEQHQYQNNADSSYGYGAIDGADVPEQLYVCFIFR